MPKAQARIAVIPDVHVPYHDEGAWGLALRVLRRIRPTHIVCIGDFADCYAISQFPKDPSRRANLKWEAERAAKEMRKLEGLSDERIFVEGNHEERLQRYFCTRAPELFGLITMRTLLGADRGGWQWVPYKKWIRIGKVAFSHDVGHSGKMALPHSLASFGGNLVFGHTHRGGTIYDGTVDGQHRVALNVGWLGDAAQIDYAHRSQVRSWQQGIGLVEQDAAGNGWCQFVPFIGRKAIVAGEVIV